MKSVLTKIFSVLLAFLIVFSTMSFTVEKHYCGDFLVDISYFGNADRCEKEMSNVSCDVTKMSKKKCCNDEIHQLKGQDKLQKNSECKFKVEQQKFIIAFVVSYSNLFENLTRQIVPHKNYSPPNLVADIQVLNEVFII